MENIELIISLAAAAVSLLAACAAFIVRMIKAVKAKIKSDGASAVLDCLAGFIETAEGLTGLSGSEKLTYVLARAESFAAENGFDFDGQSVTAKIEQLIDLSRLVNGR